MTESGEAYPQAEKMFSGPCDFVLGVSDLEQLPGDSIPEIAFAGRSNVGKSSLLNALTGRRSLARISHTPGRTQQLNFFDVRGAFYLVDMPGYGYAKVSKKMRKEWDSLIFDYMRGRANLRVVFVLVDARHGLKESDLHLLELLDAAAVSYRIVLTKADKVQGAGLKACKDEIRNILKTHPAAFPEVAVTSARKKEGIDELRETVCACVV